MCVFYLKTEIREGTTIYIDATQLELNVTEKPRRLLYPEIQDFKLVNIGLM